jgi:MFS family permease
LASSTASRRSLFRHPNYARLWTAATVSLFGTQVSQIAIPFFAAVILNASPGQVGLLVTIEFLPFLLFTLPAGVWVDRFPKKRILVLGDLGRAAMLVSIPVAFAFHGLTIWQLYVVGFVNGLMTVFFDVADQSYLPTILERDELVEGNAKLQISQSSAQILGQPFGGGIVALLSAPVAVLIDAVSYVISAGLILSIRERARGVAARLRPSDPGAALATTEADEVAPSPASAASVAVEGRATYESADAVAPDAEVDPASGVGAPDSGGGMRQQIADGLRFILHHEYLGNIAATTASSNLFGNIAFAIFPVYAYKVLVLSPAAVGTIGGIGGAGVLLGALIANRVQMRLGVGRTIILTAASFGPLGLLIPLSTPETGFWLISVSLFLGSVLNVIYNVSQISLRQAITPEHFLGRMNATMRFLVWGTIPIGSLIGAGLSEVIGIRPTIWVGALLSFLPVLPVIFSPVRRIQTIPTEEPGAVSAA